MLKKLAKLALRHAVDRGMTGGYGHGYGPHHGGKPWKRKGWKADRGHGWGPYGGHHPGHHQGYHQAGPSPYESHPGHRPARGIKGMIIEAILRRIAGR
jgi:hypothetical protein